MPVVFVIEDLHWADASTHEFVRALAAARAPRLLLLATARTDCAEAWPGERMPLDRLNESDARTVILATCSGRPLPEAPTREIVRSADGVPLFLEEITRAVIESDAVTDCGDHFAVRGGQGDPALPATLRDPLRARLDRLGPVKKVAQAAAVIGRDFPLELLQAVWPHGSGETLARDLERLVAAGILHRRGDHFGFRHSLLQREAYDSTLLAARAEHHRAVVRALDERFPELAREQPQFAAHHLARAGFPDRAAPLLVEAAEKAVARHAHFEACGLLRAALAAVRALPEAPRRPAHEGAILLGLLRSVIVVHGYAAAETLEVCEQARAVASAQAPGAFQINSALVAFHTSRAEYSRALAMIHRNRDALSDDPDAESGWTANETIVTFCCGQFRHAIECAMRTVRLYDSVRARAPIMNFDFKVIALSWRWMAEALMGQPETGARCMAAALEHSAVAGAVDTIAFARYWALTGSMLLHDFDAVAAAAPGDLEYCKEFCLSVPLALTSILYGCALAHLGQPGEGLAMARRGYTGWLATGMRIAATGHLQKIAEACLAARQPEAAREFLGEAQRMLATGEEHWMCAEIARTEALLHSAAGAPDRAEEALVRAVEIARSQEARWLELRSTLHLARLRASSGREPEAHAGLASVTSAITEGTTRREFREAVELLGELGQDFQPHPIPQIA